MTYTIYSRYDPDKVIFNGDSLIGVDLTNANFASIYSISNIDFTNANLTNADFSDRSIYNCSFKGAKLIKTDFSRVRFNSCNFTESDLSRIYVYYAEELKFIGRNIGNNKELFSLELDDFYVTYTKDYLIINDIQKKWIEWFENRITLENIVKRESKSQSIEESEKYIIFLKEHLDFLFEKRTKHFYSHKC